LHSGLPYVTRHMSHATPTYDVPDIIRHMAHVTRHTSCTTRHPHARHAPHNANLDVSSGSNYCGTRLPFWHIPTVWARDAKNLPPFPPPSHFSDIQFNIQYRNEERWSPTRSGFGGWKIGWYHLPDGARNVPLVPIEDVLIARGIVPCSKAGESAPDCVAASVCACTGGKWARTRERECEGEREKERARASE
jgi:hypothetical protein